MIVARQQGETWGTSVVQKLADDLQNEFPGISGFSPPYLWRMKQFYETYAGNEKLSPMVREIGWTHNVIILMNCKDDLQREFYIRMTRKFGWTKNVLAHQIENQTYEKTLLNQTNFNRTMTEEIRRQAKLAAKDEYTFDFLELGDEYQWSRRWWRESNKPIGVAGYKMVTSLPAELGELLPSPEQIAGLLEGVK